MSNLKIQELERFIRSRFKGHYECGDSFYSCPKSPDYFGDDADAPIEDRPCKCGYDEAMRLLNTPDWKDPQLQFEAEEPDMPKGDW